ncbi:hypothetical protein CSKR_107072 [Clonorchis sinensis]|uniref:Uncharacterized protein n=1 Tax=Clonorchis sinensis TaxID=79923 RepID=A0A419PD88_CLOSI|nr:hypothetical protein CSKR_107072 [Clonorchis sinensis]
MEKVGTRDKDPSVYGSFFRAPYILSQVRKSTQTSGTFLDGQCLTVHRVKDSFQVKKDHHRWLLEVVSLFLNLSEGQNMIDAFSCRVEPSLVFMHLSLPVFSQPLKDKIRGHRRCHSYQADATMLFKRLRTLFEEKNDSMCPVL